MDIRVYKAIVHGNPWDNLRRVRLEMGRKNSEGY